MTPKPKANPNALLLAIRKYHTYFGLFAAIFLITVAATGIYLNHKNTFRSLFGEEKHEHSPEAKFKMPSASEIASLPIRLSDAVELASKQLDMKSLERIELRPEHGRLVYKVKSVGGSEVVIDAYTGSMSLHGEHEEKPGREKGMDWGKAIKDLHTGKIGGDAGKLFVDLVAVLLIVLSMTGIYLWAIPSIRKRRSARERAARQTTT